MGEYAMKLIAFPIDNWLAAWNAIITAFRDNVTEQEVS
jgi:hypothetical protein